MRISYQWLQTLVATDLNPEDLGHQLTLAGFEVESIEDRRTWADGVIVGQVVDCQPHPNADKLRVCQVDLAQESPATIVCGAPNVATGQYVAVATVGTYLPTVDLKIKPAKLRGVQSSGMICSLAELGLARDSEGIHTFDPDAQSFQIGDDVRPLLGLDDIILDLTSTANRADALSMVGIAREVVALTGQPLTLPPLPERSSPPTASTLQVSVADPVDCPAYMATRLEGVKVGPSPEWLQRRLEAAGIRAINNVVDITNYILLEWGQPLHAFDAERLEAIAGTETLTLGVRATETADQVQPLITLDAQPRTLDLHNLLITVNQKPIALAGVMGGQESEVHGGTTTIILEAALFNSVAIRRSARAQGLRTEASARYERGVNEAQLDVACHHALTLLEELTGAKVVAQAIADSRQTTPRTLSLRLERVQQVLGPVWDAEGEPVDLEAPQMIPILESLGFGVMPIEEDGVWQVEVPAHRLRDIEREIDLIEEIARLYGYDNFCDTLPAKTEFGFLSEDEQFSRWIREAFRAEGLTELMHYSWSKPGGDRQIQVVNPLLIEFSALRTEMITQLIKVFKYNLEQGNGPLNGFELGRIFWKDELGLHETPAIAGIIGGDPTRGQWSRGQRGETPLSWFEAKGMLTAVFERLGIEVEYQPDRQDARLHPGRTASLWLQGTYLGRFGQLHPSLRQEYELPEAVYVFELDFYALLDGMTQVQQSNATFTPYSAYPAMDRDLAFYVATNVSVAELERVMRKAVVKHKDRAVALTEMTLIDEYRGESVPSGKRSLAFRLVYRASDRTLTDEEVTPIHQEIRDALEAAFDLTLRS
jgi:phenylalanyl-tRNA synthetase beta chain